MRTSSSGAFLLLLIGAVGLIGYLTGNLDRWLAYLFTPPGAMTTGTLGTTAGAATAAGAPIAGNRRVA